MSIERLLLLALATALPHGDDGKVDVAKLKERAHEKDLLLGQLVQLQRRVRSGEMPTDAELALARTSREEVLRGVDVRRALQLGVEPRTVRDRLLPAFAVELDSIAKPRADGATTGSPLLASVLDLEEDLRAEADRRRLKASVPSPFESGPLSKRLDPMATSSDAATSAKDPNAPAPAGDKTLTLPKGLDPRLAGQVLYRAGHYAEALAAWKDVKTPSGEPGLELEYQRADCLLHTDDVQGAIAVWDRLAKEHKDSTWGRQSEFSLRVAKALAAFEQAKKGPQ
jgi:hypothetical protein